MVFSPFLLPRKVDLKEAKVSCQGRNLKCSWERRWWVATPQHWPCSPHTQSLPPSTHTTVWNYIRAGSGKLVCGAHSCCINIYKTCWWTLQMSKCLLFRLLCQYLLRTGSMGILQGFCLFGGLVLGMEIQQAFLSRWTASPTARSPRRSPSLHR